jgi:uncharacterized protein (DUF486 family)
MISPLHLVLTLLILSNLLKVFQYYAQFKKIKPLIVELVAYVGIKKTNKLYLKLIKKLVAALFKFNAVI